MESILIAILFFLPGTPQSSGVEYLDKVWSQFSGIKDYTVDVRVHFDVKELQSPDMQATIYYKAPDKVRVKSKGLFIMPREAGVFNPSKFNPSDYTAAVEDTLTYGGNPAVEVSVAPKKKGEEDRKLILVIDEKDWLVREIKTPPSSGKKVRARITYATVDGFNLPSEMDVTFDVNKTDGEIPNPGRDRRRLGGVSGSVQIYYSNYRVNTGLSDEIFKREEGSR